MKRYPITIAVVVYLALLVTLTSVFWKGDPMLLPLVWSLGIVMSAVLGLAIAVGVAIDRSFRKEKK